MAASRDKSNDRTRGVSFTKESAKAIAESVRTVAAGDRRMGGISGGSSSYASSHYLAKTSSAWSKGSKQTLTIWSGDGGSETSSGETVEAWNKTGGDVESGKWVLLARANGTFYLAEPEVIELDVITGASLGSGGLKFTRETVYVVGKKTPKPSDITISTTACT